MGSNLGVYRGRGTPFLAWPEDRIQDEWQESLQSRGIHSGRTQQRENQGGWRVGGQLPLRTASSQETGC